MIYLDNAATTFPKPECVYRTVDNFSRTGAVNAGRGAYAAAREATDMIKGVKRSLISMFDARGQAEVVLTHSVTIALNQIINGQKWREGMNAYITPYEHNAVSRPLDLMRRRYGINVRLLPLNEDLSIDIERTAKLFEEFPPDFVCATAVSNVTGYVLPTAEIFRMARPYGAFTVLDAAQAAGLVKMRFSQQFADCIAFAGHKTLYAPFGVAGFLVRNNVNLEEFIVGGNGIQSEKLGMPAYMPEKMESSSMNTPAIAGLAASLEWLKGRYPLKEEQELTEYLVEGLRKLPDVVLYEVPGGVKNQAGIVSFNITGFRANEVAAILDYKSGIAVRAGHHCAAYIHKFLKNKEFDGTVRVSLSMMNTREDVDALLEALKAIDYRVLKNISAEILRGNC